MKLSSKGNVPSSKVLLNEVIKQGECPKFQSTYTGPLLVINAIHNLDYIIRTDKKGKQTVVHHNKLKPYEGQKRPRWIVQALSKLK